jgi:2-C-methyl-D-erythritol 4-phosphate cytidylyltransferase/2-C-methyl-D-erythritol 4-phosphate cytidylyltransferase/2-C-methyl-D-erythritol 2,4-cyclodiphosphate synthase
MAHKVAVIIAAGGRGRRMGVSLPKQFLPLAGIPILWRTITLFDALPEVREIIVVAPHGHIRRVERLAERAHLMKKWSVVSGGKERQHSVWNGLRRVGESMTLVLVHDAVRPLVTAKTVRAVIRAAQEYGAAVAALPLKDTVKLEGEKGFFASTLERERLWTVQTPQGFKKELLIKAHRSAQRKNFIGTDESCLVERLHVPVRIVQGECRNLKITTAEDLAVATIFAKSARKR